MLLAKGGAGAVAHCCEKYGGGSLGDDSIFLSEILRMSCLLGGALFVFSELQHLLSELKMNPNFRSYITDCSAGKVALFACTMKL